MKDQHAILLIILASFLLGGILALAGTLLSTAPDNIVTTKYVPARLESTCELNEAEIYLVWNGNRYCYPINLLHEGALERIQ